MDSPRASNADPFSCLLAFRASRLFSFMVALYRMNGGMGQGLGVKRQRATVLHGCNVSASSCPHALQGRSIPTTNDGVGIFFACIPLRWQRVHEPACGTNRSNATHRRLSIAAHAITLMMPAIAHPVMPKRLRVI